MRPEYADKESLLDRWKKVAGDAPSSRFEPVRFFRVFKAEGTAFAGITDCYSRDWFERLRAEGVSDVRTFGVGLDDILLHVAGKGLWAHVGPGAQGGVFRRADSARDGALLAAASLWLGTRGAGNGLQVFLGVMLLVGVLGVAVGAVFACLPTAGLTPRTR